jgi:hypothetical protein
MVWLAVLMAVSQESASTCVPAPVSPRAAALLRPVLSEYFAAYAEESDAATA